MANISPAYLYPALGLLLNSAIEASSGLQYLPHSIASNYSIYSFKIFPPSWAKVRENIIYVLGNLKEKRTVPLFGQVLELPDWVEEPRALKPSPCPFEEQKELDWPKIKLLTFFVIMPVIPQPDLRLIWPGLWGELVELKKKRLGA